MDAREFTRIALTFADAPTDCDLTKGELLLQIRDELVNVTLSQREGALYVTEDEDTRPAVQWLINRLARLPLLAERLLTFLPTEPHFVAPSGHLLDQIDFEPEDEPDPVPDALETAQQIIDRRPGGTTSVLYLTSDAGEGKTTIIQELARAQAEAYKKKQSDWLLVPVALGGRPFLRLDEVVVSALVNRFRFQLLYYDAFVELIRLGVIVPALDGFEEMFVESSGEAVSALGNLVQMLKSSGTILVAARKAFFEYKSFKSQARLFDSLGTESVAFARLALDRWSRDQFLGYAQKRSMPEGNVVYEDVSSALGEDHPLLTRAVLVRRLLDVAAKLEDRKELLETLHGMPEESFATFTRAIVEREANDKWIDRSGDPAKPILTVEEHVALLSLVAEEMWKSHVDELSEEMVDFVAQLFCETEGKSALKSRQIIERLKQHALIVKRNAGRQTFAFDHEEFMNFFLGIAAGRTVGKGVVADTAAFLRSGPIPEMAADMTLHRLKADDKTEDGLRHLVNVCVAEGPASYARENCGSLIIRILGEGSAAGSEVTGALMPTDSLANRRIAAATFKDCYFQPTVLHNTRLEDCVFEKCEFERLEIDTGNKISSAVLRDSIVRSVVLQDKDVTYFDPSTIDRLLGEAGFSPEPSRGAALQLLSPERPAEPDEALVLVTRALRPFQRATEVNEGVLRQRLGQKASMFFDSVLPSLLRSGTLRVVPYKGGGRQARYRLSIRMSVLEDALVACQGGFDEFMRIVSAQEDH